MFNARPYQIECVQTMMDYYVNGGTGNQCVALPTGTGKSVIPPMFMQMAMMAYPKTRCLVLTHVQELISQNHRALQTVWPTSPSSIYSAGLGRKEAYAPIVLGGVASVVNSMDLIGFRDFLFIDEAHLLSPKESSMYQRVIESLLKLNPYLKVIGLTATPFRMGQGRLIDPVYKNGVLTPAMFTDITYDLTGIAPFNKLIDDAYLSPLIPKSTENVIDVSDVRQLANDFNRSQLYASIERQGITGRALIEAADLCRDRKSWIVFGAGIQNCLQIRDILLNMGISAVAVHSNTEDHKMTREEVTVAIDSFKAGRFQAIVSNNILTTGFDHPQIDAIIDLRPTISIPLHIQKYGRGTRPYYAPWYTFEHLRYLEYRKQAILEGGKQNCIVLDFAGNTPRLGPINDPKIPSAKKSDGGGDVPIKMCDVCGAYNHTTARVCVDCGNEFVFKTKIKATASTNEIIVRNEANIEQLAVSTMFPRIHTKPGKPDTLKVQYLCGIRLFNVWLSFSGTGLAKHKAREWWRQHGEGEPPESTEEAMARFSECRQTSFIKVNTADKYPEILEYLF